MSIPTIAREVRTTIDVRQLIRESDDRDEQIRRTLAEVRTIRMPDLREPTREPLPVRPHRLRRILIAASAVIVLAGAAIGLATRADAVPGQCGGGGFGGNGGNFCDWDGWSDGSFMHRETVCVLGFCGTNTFRACDDGHGGRVPTDNDPATPC